MSTFTKLVLYEVNRFRYVLFSLMLMTALVQVGVWFGTILPVVSERKEELLRHTGSDPLHIEFTFVEAIYDLRLWLMIPVVACIAVIGFYIFFIWYRDWIGRSPFIYRLLMLPTPRRQLYLSKLSAILIFTFSLVAFQVLIVFLLLGLYELTVPAELQRSSHEMDVFLAVELWEVLLPKALDQFVFSYGLGIVGVLVLFTAILMERSYRGIGIAYGIAYVVVCAAAVFWPIAELGIGRPGSWFYPNEIAIMFLVVCVLVAAVSLWLGFRLLNKKITV